MSRIIAYGEWYIKKGRVGFGPMKRGLMPRSGPARRIAETKLKQDAGVVIAEFEPYVEFFERCKKLLEKNKTI